MLRCLQTYLFYCNYLVTLQNFTFYRYTEGNTRLSSDFRAYNKSLPSYLHNKPEKLVKHCMERLTLADDFTDVDVKVTDASRGKFLVKSQRSAKQWYRLHFGDESENVSPSCECFDWERNRLPCKHFFAVFTHIPGWSYIHLPAFYRDSPFLTLDNMIILSNVPSTSDCQLHESNNDLDDFNNVEQTDRQPETKTSDYKTLPLPKSHAKATAARCRDSLHEIKNLTYIINDQQVLTDLDNTLQACLKTIQNAASTSNGLILESNSHKKTNKKKRKKVKQSKDSNVGEKTKRVYKRTPKPLKKKHPYSGRSGAKADAMKKHMYVNISLAEQNNQLKRKREASDTRDGTAQRNGDKKPKIQDNLSTIQKSTTHCHSLESRNKADSEEPIITQVTKTDRPVVKRRKIILQQEDYSIIEDSVGWLTATIISAVNMALHNQFHQIQGLQNTTLSKFETVTDNFIQMLHSNSNHWVMVSNIGCSPGQINYYDSFYHSITPSVKKQIKSFFPGNVEEIKVNIMPVQQQTNGSDCGVFSVAFSTSLLHGQDPCDATYDTSVMRQHLKKCLQINHFQPFPLSVRPVVKCRSYTYTIKWSVKQTSQ